MASQGNEGTFPVTNSRQNVDSSPRKSPPTVRRRTPTRRTPLSASSSSTRVSPYPLRVRTPPQASPPAAHGLSRVSLDASSQTGDQHRLQLIVRPIVKDTVVKHDSSGSVLEDFAANGATFSDILHKTYRDSVVSCNAVQVESTPRSDDQNRTSLEQVGSVRTRGDSITDGVRVRASIPNARVLEEFKSARIHPEHTDRAGATAEVSLREVEAQLRDIWGETYKASAVVWRMWANNVTRNLDRSAWEVGVLDPPTARVERLLHAADSQVEQHLAGVSRSARLALDVVNSSIADNSQLHKDWEAFGRRLLNQQHALAARKEVIEAFLADVTLPPASEVDDPVENMENISDTEHQE
ncbi:unnamed protein product [Phytophthora fragariaefolia]|uniref:Unnamed protein product n=1 Tax=Phytophthora fragariaefolia TaxID=1490495 RepID=A0A9W7DC12_9STRA|nr:unnamed protein product [Phytophthora fragariaefolia]